jgi:hypothetical protein
MKNKNYIKNNRGQFYLIATIIIIGLVIGLVVIFNYSTNTSSSDAEEIAKELSIESQKVLDYDFLHPANAQFENFAKDYSSYVGSDKSIYFITVDGSEQHAYKYTEGQKVSLDGDLSVVSGEIQFSLDSKVYSFKLEKGKNFYFVLIYDREGERYVFTG